MCVVAGSGMFGVYAGMSGFDSGMFGFDSDKSGFDSGKVQQLTRFLCEQHLLIQVSDEV